MVTLPARGRRVHDGLALSTRRRPAIDEPFAAAFKALEPLEDMEEATCALHDLADQASALRRHHHQGQALQHRRRKLDELPPGLRGSLQKLSKGMSGVKAMQSRLKPMQDQAWARTQSGLEAVAAARLQLALEAVERSGERLQMVGTELRKLAGLAQSATYWDRPVLCKEVEDRRANRLIATTESTGGGGKARLLAQIKAYEEILEQARGSGAIRCAPKSLAEAEAQAEFARIEIKLGHWFKAKTAAQKAGTLAVRTREERARVRLSRSDEEGRRAKEGLRQRRHLGHRRRLSGDPRSAQTQGLPATR